MDTNQTSGKRKLKKGLKVGCLSVVSLFLIVVLLAVGWVFYVTQDVEVNDADLIIQFENVPDEINGYFALERAIREFVENSTNSISFSPNGSVPSDQNLEAYCLFVRDHPNVIKGERAERGQSACRTGRNGVSPLGTGSGTGSQERGNGVSPLRNGGNGVRNGVSPLNS